MDPERRDAAPTQLRSRRSRSSWVRKVAAAVRGGAPLLLDVSQWKKNRVICSRQVTKKALCRKLRFKAFGFSEVNTVPTVFTIRPGTPLTYPCSACARVATSLLLSSSPSARAPLP